MKIDIITLFPKMFEGPFSESMISRAQKNGIVKIKTHQLRDWAINSHGQVDDRPYGGGAGMIMRVDVASKALASFRNQKSKVKNQNDKSKLKNKKLNTYYLIHNTEKPYIILPTPSGKKFDQALARKLSKKKHLVFLCPHYEGYDKRIESLVDEKISIGDYVLTGGELPAMSMIDATVRLMPGVIKARSLEEESFSCRGEPLCSPKTGQTRRSAPTEERYLEYAQYTRPEVFEMKVNGKKIKKRVPKVLLSGNHALISKWRSKTR